MLSRKLVLGALQFYTLMTGWVQEVGNNVMDNVDSGFVYLAFISALMTYS